MITSVKHLLLVIILAAVTVAAPAAASAEGSDTSTAQPDLQWVEGKGQQLQMGTISKLKLKEGYAFLDGQNTKDYIKQYGGLPSDMEIGAITPIDENEDWMVYFEYLESGHVLDDEKTEIDADALLESYKEGTEEGNKKLAKENQMTVEGWLVPPAYNESLHSLTWSLLAHDYQDNKFVNYNIRLLTRVGYISAILVSDPEHLDADRQKFEREVLPGLTIKPGQTYSDYDASSDKTSEYGLSGLILGGVGLAVAKKVGLLATLLVFFKKFFIVLLAPLLWVWNKLRRKSRQQAENSSTPNPDIANDTQPPAAL